MNICTAFCLLPSAIQRRGRHIRVNGPFGPVDVVPLRMELTRYRGSRLRNGSVAIYVRHILSELRRILGPTRSWTLRNGTTQIDHPDTFYEESFDPDCRSRDILRSLNFPADG